ncbi:early nodulin-like protein 18 [Salvia miltiorrhiza]|uniref:early nodulin-like protein 18 n=1 Tax=Salvia miltiorrhiza TaxID=226208 RepID=UPI0025AD268E|nr:early nodulin-like protein 18 [Salvia miltiorrhiza]
MRMGKKRGLIFFFLIISLSLYVDAYKNYTVGDSLGWYDILENSKIDYHKWTAGKNFSLGDFLIFNTDNNHTVIQTYNFTTYKLCDYNNALDNDTIEWSAADPSATTPQSVSVAVPLTKVGMTYFFSSDYDGEQCLNGQRFQINVTYGQGLPPSLRPDDGSPGPVSPESGDDESVPDTLVPSNFDNPKDTTDDQDETSNSIPLSAFSKLIGIQLHGLLIVLGFFILYC